MGPDLPRITVVTPSFNQGQFLERTIRSVLDQEYPNLEYFVMDGGSTDGSVEIIQRYADRIDFWASQPDGGQAAAINAGWRRATGEILCWLNSDDYYLPGTLNLVGRYLSEHPDTAILYGSCERVDANGRRSGYLGMAFSRRALLYSHQIVPQPSAFFSRSAVGDAAPLREELVYSFDYDLILRIARSNRPIVYVDRPLAAFTVHRDAKTTRHRDLAKRETHLVRRRYATGPGRLVIACQPMVSAIYQALPRGIRRGVDLLRARRIHDVPPRSRAGGDDQPG